MGKYIKIFFGIIFISFIFFLILSGFFHVDGAHILESPLLSIGTVIIFLLSYLIAQIQYLIDKINKPVNLPITTPDEAVSHKNEKLEYPVDNNIREKDEKIL